MLLYSMFSVWMLIVCRLFTFFYFFVVFSQVILSIFNISFIGSCKSCYTVCAMFIISRAKQIDTTI